MRVMHIRSMVTVCLFFTFWPCDAGASQFSPRTILVVTAVDYEYNAVSSLLERRKEFVLSGRQVSDGSYGGSRVVVIRAGWGKAQAAGATALAIKLFAPGVVIMAGVGGGIDTANITSGDVVIAQSTFQYDLGKLSQSQLEIWPPETPQEKPYPSANFDSDSQLVTMAVHAARKARFNSWKLASACSCDNSGTVEPGCMSPVIQVDRVEPRVCAGIVASGDAFLVDPSVSERLVSGRKVESVDMETAAVAEEASNSGIPFLGVRVVADVVNGANENLYYCLKPYSGPRLKEVMSEIMNGLRKELSTRASDDSNLSCRGTTTVPQQIRRQRFIRVR